MFNFNISPSLNCNSIKWWVFVIYSFFQSSEQFWNIDINTIFVNCFLWSSEQVNISQISNEQILIANSIIKWILYTRQLASNWIFKEEKWRKAASTWIDAKTLLACTFAADRDHIIGLWNNVQYISSFFYIYFSSSRRLLVKKSKMVMIKYFVFG